MDSRQLNSFPIDRVALDRELVKRGGLRAFVKLAWPIIEPVPLVSNWHVDLICEVLQAAFDREIRKFIINIPPGCMKSRLVASLYPAWCWAEDPTECFLYASFDQGLSDRDARSMRDIVASQWFQDRWPEAKLPRSAVRQVRDFKNSRGGWRFSTSVGGKGTGRHPHQIIVDDPIKPADTIGGADTTRKAIDGCISWYRGTISTRQADPVNTIHGLIMQRLHDNDLAGALSAEWAGDPAFVHVMLPMHFDRTRAFSFPALGLADPRTDDKALLWPQRFPEPEVDKLTQALGIFADAQLEQDPVAKEGGTFKLNWIQYWSPGGSIANTVSLPPIGTDVISWDCAFKGKDSSDPSCGGALRRAMGRFFVLDVEWGRWDFPGLQHAVIRLCQRNPRIIKKLVEDKANGPAIIASLQGKFPGFVEVNPEGGKEARANAVAGLFQAKLVFLPHPSLFPWVTPLIQELIRFPRASHDDGVDMLTQGLVHLYQGPGLVELMNAIGRQ